MKPWSIFLFFFLGSLMRAESPRALVLQSDFGTRDGAVAAMRGVAFGVDPDVRLFDLSHANTPYDIWEAAYRLQQAAPYWPASTVFVSVVDPGVGTERASVVLRTKAGQLFVGPDNGTWTLVGEAGVDAVRRIDETKNRRVGSEESYTFHGRDVYVYVGARLATGKLAFEDVGPLLEAKVVSLPYERARREGDALVGTIPALDFQYGNVWTNIPSALFQALSPEFGERFHVTITSEDGTVFQGDLPYTRTFGDVEAGAPLLYLNSLLNVSIALNQGDFAKAHKVRSGSTWHVRIQRVNP